MSLKSDLSKGLVEAMKAHDELKVGVLRLISSAIQAKGIEKRAKGSEELSDTEVVDILRAEVKKRREAAQIFEKAGRNDLAEKEQSETKIILAYLPPEMSAAEVNEAVKRIVAQSGAKNFGDAMKAVMAELRGKADAKIIGDAVKSTIGE